MSCSFCPKAKLIPTCTDEVVIGTIEPNTDYWVFIKDLTTGAIFRQDSTSDGAGLVSFDASIPRPETYSPDHIYELWVTEAGSTTIDDSEVITIDGSMVECLTLTFEKTLDEDGNPNTYTTQTIELAE